MSMSPSAQDVRSMRAEALLKNPYVRAMLGTIAEAEGGGYNTLYGGATFSGYSQFPGSGGHTPSGRYQVTKASYEFYGRNMLGVTDFSPHTQDLIAVQQLIMNGAMKHLLLGDFDGALDGASQTWASLPQGPNKGNRHRRQPYMTYERTKNLFYALLGQ